MEIEEIENILDHYKNPRNYGELPDATLSHERGNPICGDVVRFDLKIENNKVKDVKFKGKGCAISQAAASMLTEIIHGKDIDQLKSITGEEVLSELKINVSPIRFDCALLSLNVLKQALRKKLKSNNSNEIL